MLFFSDMERKTLAITPPPSSSSSFFHLRGRGGGRGFGSSKKAFHCLLLLSCLLLSSVNTLHNLAEFDNTCDVGFINGYNIALSPATKGIQSFQNGEDSVSDQNVCFLSALGSESQFDGNPNVIISNNNLSDGVVWLSLKPVHIIEFLHHQTFTGLFHIGEEYTKQKNRDESSVVSVSVSSKGNGFMDHQCEWDSIEFLFFYRTEVKKKKNSVVVSSGNGFMEQNQCYECWDSIKFLFFYRKEIAVFAVPMKATAPVLMLNLCKKPVFWVQRTTKKLSIIAVLVIAVAALLVLLFCFFVEENDNCNHIAVREVEQKPITISPQMDSLLRSISKEDFNEVSEMNSSTKPIASVSSKEEASEESVNLTVKTAKRRRNKNKKKKKGGAGVINNGLSLLLTDVSSSHSGNSSTPNSPMSQEPATIQDTAMIKKTIEPAKPVLSHSATFPVSGVKSMIIERSSLALNVRAPGSKPMKSRTEVKEEEETTKKAKEYDIWGDHHLTGLNLMDKLKEVREGKSSGFVGEDEDDDESESLFVKGPLNYLADSHVRFVSFCNQWG